MVIKLIVTDSQEGEKSSREYEFRESTIPIGRAVDNVLVLNDPQKQVSNRHALIERSGNSYYLQDSGSTNGTFLNSRRIEPGKKMPVASGDSFSMGGFDVVVLTVDDGDEFDSTKVQVDPARKASRAAESLAEIYARHLESPPAERRDMIRKLLLSSIETCGPAQARTVLSKVLQHFHGARVGEPPSEQAQDEGTTEDLYLAGHKAMTSLSESFLGKSDFQSPRDVERFCEQIRCALDSTFEWVAKALKGRGEFKDQFSAEVTLLFGLAANPIKSHAGAQEMARYLLEWRESHDREKAMQSLKHAFKDLTLHQLGLISGVQQCMRELLRRLSPEVIEEEAADQEVGFFTMGKAARAQRAWQQYVQIYKEVFDDNSKLFNEIIYPFVQRGYLEAHDDS